VPKGFNAVGRRRGYVCCTRLTPGRGRNYSFATNLVLNRAHKAVAEVSLMLVAALRVGSPSSTPTRPLCSPLHRRLEQQLRAESQVKRSFIGRNLVAFANRVPAFSSYFFTSFQLIWNQPFQLNGTNCDQSVCEPFLPLLSKCSTSGDFSPPPCCYSA